MWTWLSPLLIVLGCIGLAWSFRSSKRNRRPQR